MTLFLEYCWTLNARKGNMMPYGDVMKKTGFRSVYAFDVETASKIKEAGHSRGFNQYLPYAVELLIDLDSPDFVAEAVENITALGWRYSLWSSGSKGAHIHIPHNISHGYSLPDEHLKLAQMVSKNCDISLYRNNSIFRLPGTIHQKTGLPKVMIGNGGTKLLTLEDHYPGEPKRAKIDFDFSGGQLEESELSLSLGALQGYLGRQPPEGRRYQTLWSIAKGLRDGGLSARTVEELVEVVNKSWLNPKEETEIARLMKDVFKL